MPRIRKKTSNRGTTHQRSKIKQKASETRKKNKRAAKKDITWKSNKTKDPGIPASFPYKDQILAEVAEQRRLNEEEKQRLRDERKAGKAPAVAQPESDDDEDDPLGVNTLRGTRVMSGKASKLADNEDDDVEDDDEMMDDSEEADDGEAAPILFDADLPTLQAALEQADVLLEVVDARDPLGFRSPWLEELFVQEDDEGKKGKLVVVLTKIDLVPREALQQWLLYLRPRFPTILFKSKLPSNRAPPGPTQKQIKNAPMHPIPLTGAAKAAEDERRSRLAPEEVLGREELLLQLEKWAGERKAPKGDFTVIVAGLPNVGKSSLLNTLLTTNHFPTAVYPPTSAQSKVTTTTPCATIYTSPMSSTKIRFVDTPGWIFADVFPGDDADEEESEQDDDDELKSETEEEAEMWETIEVNRVKDLLRRNIGRIDRIKEPLPLAEYIIAHCNPNDLMLLYSTPAFLSSEPQSFLTSLARVQGRLKRKGVADLDSAARVLLRDWALEQFPHYTTPPGPKGATLDPLVPAELDSLTLFKTREEETLARCRTRRELIGEKGGRGVVRMNVDETFKSDGGDLREVVLDDELRQDSEGSVSDDGEGWEDDEDDEMEWDGEGEEVYPEGQEGEEPVDDMSDLQEDGDASDEEPSDDEAPSMLDLINAAKAAAKGSKGKKRAAPAAAARPSKKAAVSVVDSKKVVFAAQPKGKTPKGNGLVDEVNGKGPVSILKSKKKVQTAVAVEPVVESKKAIKKGKKEATATVTTSPVKEKKAAKPVAAVTAAPKKPTTSKAADRAKADKGEVPYSFDQHFF